MRLRLVKRVRDYIVSAKKAAIFVTHNIEEGIAISDTIVVFGGQPAKIAYQTDVAIPDTYRDLINVRKSNDFHQIFEKIWKLMNM